MEGPFDLISEEEQIKVMELLKKKTLRTKAPDDQQVKRLINEKIT
jgi:hypothetical protein